MLGNSDQKFLFSPSSPHHPNQWPSHHQQNNQLDDLKETSLNNNNMGSVGTGRVGMEKKLATTTTITQQEDQQQPQQQQQKQQQQEALRCPRCDSNNTKFCYYNNYSLSQPRHFCKACKRYWTRGGTLRNVPVGGGCRKNKRVKRPSSSSNNINNISSSSSSSSQLDHNNPQHDLISSATNHHHLNVNHPLIYSHHDMNLFPFSSRYDQFNNGVGLGFSSSLSCGLSPAGFSSSIPASKQIFQDLMISSSNPLLSTTPNTSSSSSSTLSSLMASNLQIKGSASNNFQALFPSSYDDDDQVDLQMKGFKMEHQLQQQQWSSQQPQNQMDPSSDIWGGANNNNNHLGAWPNPSSNNNSIGSSVPSLI